MIDVRIPFGATIEYHRGRTYRCDIVASWEVGRYLIACQGTLIETGALISYGSPAYESMGCVGWWEHDRNSV